MNDFFPMPPSANARFTYQWRCQRLKRRLDRLRVQHALSRHPGDAEFFRWDDPDAPVYATDTRLGVFILWPN